MRFQSIVSVLLLAFASVGSQAQTRSMAQDPKLDNLTHPAGTATIPYGTLGNVRKFGEGRRKVVLIPGLGFGDSIWAQFMERHEKHYSMYAVTLPGFGDTSPLPMPPSGTPYAETPWTGSSVKAIKDLLDKEDIDRVTIVAHWALASQIALRLALDHPDRVESVVLIGGPLKVFYEGMGSGMLNWSREQRRAFVEGMAQRWFKTVTSRTWHDNNFMSYDYAINPRRGLFLWREAQSPQLAVWIRYLLEFYSIDLTPELEKLEVPTLVVQPGFDDPSFYVENDLNYMRNLCIDSWKGAAELSTNLEFVTIARSRLFVMFDQPEELDSAIERFFELRSRKEGRSTQ